MSDALFRSLSEEVKKLDEKITNLGSAVKDLGTAVDLYRNLVITLEKRIDKYENDREQKCFVRFGGLSEKLSDVSHKMEQIKSILDMVKEDLSDYKGKVDMLDRQTTESEARLTNLSSQLSTQLIELKDIVTDRDKELKSLSRKLDDIGWVADLGNQFKRVIIGFIVAIFIATLGLYSIGYKAFFELKEAVVSKKELVDALRQLQK